MLDEPIPVPPAPQIIPEILSEYNEPLMPQEPGELRTPPWRWGHISWLVMLFLIGATLLGALYGVILLQTSQTLAPALQLAIIFSQVYLLLIFGVYWFAIRRAGASWQQLGIRRPNPGWMTAVPFIFIGQLLTIAFVNLAVMGLSNSNGFENPQLDAFEQALAVPAIKTQLTNTNESSPSPTVADATSAKAADAGKVTNNVKTSNGVNESAVDAQLARLTRNVTLSRFDLFWLILAIGVIAPFSEELFFRGMLYPLQRRKQRVAIAIFFNGLLFSAVHFIPVLLPALFVIGIILAWVREKSGSIWPSFTLHMMQNSMAIYVIYSVVNQI